MTVNTFDIWSRKAISETCPVFEVNLQKSFSCLENSISDICQKSDFATLLPLFERVLCAPASSAPVERIFSQSGLIVRPHQAKMSDQLLEALTFLKCNSKLCD